MNDKVNILVLSAGRRVELVQAFQKALGRHYPEASVFTTDVAPYLAAACHISSRGFKAPRVTAPDYIDFLIDLCLRRRIGMIIPTIDTELIVLSRNRQRFENANINAIISEPELVSSFRDKRVAWKTFEELGIDQPALYDRDALVFPCFCKPYDGSCSIGATAILSREMLSGKLLADERNMFMEMINKEYKEYTVDAYYNQSGDLCCLVPRERLEVRSGEVSKGITRKNFVYRYLLERLPQLTGARGCLTIQVFANLKTNSIKALEINPRFGGGYPLSHAAGADYPDWLIREYFMKEKIEFSDNWESNLTMLRYDAKVVVHDAD